MFQKRPPECYLCEVAPLITKNIIVDCPLYQQQIITMVSLMTIKIYLVYLPYPLDDQIYLRDRF